MTTWIFPEFLILLHLLIFLLRNWLWRWSNRRRQGIERVCCRLQTDRFLREERAVWNLWLGDHSIAPTYCTEPFEPFTYFCSPEPYPLKQSNLFMIRTWLLNAESTLEKSDFSPSVSNWSKEELLAYFPLLKCAYVAQILGDNWKRIHCVGKRN